MGKDDHLYITAIDGCLVSSRTEEKFTRKLEDPFYKESIKISDLPLAKLLDRIRKVTSKKGNEADKEQFSNDVLCKTFFSFGRSGKSSSITALVKSDTHLDQLHKASYELIEWYAEHPLRASISSMYNNLGMPDRGEVEKLVASCSDDKGKLNEKLFRSITGMQAGCGMPDLEALKALEVFCTKDGEFNQDLFSSITGMQSGRGVPDLNELPAFLEALEALEVFCTKDGEFNQDLFSSITGMQCGRGVPDLEALKALEVFCTKDGEFNQDLFRSITGMQNGCGVPNLEALRELKDFCIKSLINSGSAWQELFSSICVMQIGSGIPEPAILAKLTELYSILQGPELKSWLKEKLLSFPINERLPELYKKLNSDRFKTGNPLELYAMLPPEICPKFSKLDLSTAYVRLDLRDQIVFLSSGEERVVASILYKYGLIKTFNDGENLHVRASKEHRIDLDFLLDNIPLFIEYHPLSQRERKSGRDIKQAAQRKINSTLGGDYHDHEVLHIEKLNDLPGIFINHPQISRLITQHLGRQLTTEELNHDLKQANDSSSWTEIPINKISA